MTEPKTRRTPVSIVLADDHTLMRQSLRLLIERQPEFQVVGEASTGLEAVQLVERLKPTLLVLDLMMPVLNGLEVLKQIQKTGPTRTIILSMHSNEAYVLEALRNGAFAYVLKQSTASNLVHALQEVVAGRHYLSPPISERAIESYLRKTNDTLRSPSAALTLRENEILALIAEGRTNAEIGQRLKISSRTVEHHRANLMRKLKCRNQAELIRQALFQANPEFESLW